MTTNKPQDILDELTKDELLAWLRTQFLRLPKRSDILFIRWQLQSAALEDEWSKEIRSFDNLDFAERDRIARKFNESKDSAEKLRLMEQIRKYDHALRNHIERSQKLERKQKRVDKLYEQIDIERKREARA